MKKTSQSLSGSFAVRGTRFAGAFGWVFALFLMLGAQAVSAQQIELGDGAPGTYVSSEQATKTLLTQLSLPVTDKSVTTKLEQKFLATAVELIQDGYATEDALNETQSMLSQAAQEAGIATATEVQAVRESLDELLIH